MSLINRQLQMILKLNSEIIIISFSTGLWKISVILLIRCLHVVLEARENGGLSTKWPYQIMKKSLKYIYIKRFPPPKVPPPLFHTFPSLFSPVYEISYVLIITYGLSYMRLKWSISLMDVHHIPSRIPFLVLFTFYIPASYWRWYHLGGALVVVGAIMNRVVNQFRGRLFQIHSSADYKL